MHVFPLRYSRAVLFVQPSLFIKEKTHLALKRVRQEASLLAHFERKISDPH